MNRFGAQLRKLRLAQNLTQEQLAEAAETSRVTVQNRERGTYRPDIDQRESYAAALGVSLNHLNLVIDGKITAEECLARERRAGQLPAELIPSATDGSHGTHHGTTAAAIAWSSPSDGASLADLGAQPYAAAWLGAQENATNRRDAITGAIALAAEAAIGMPALSARAASESDHAELGVLSALKLPPSLQAAFSSDRCPCSAVSQVEALSAASHTYFSTQDAAVGGGVAQFVARALHHQAGRWSEQPGHAPPLARAIQTLHLELGTWAGWLAYDASQLRSAQHYLQDTILRARLIDCPSIEVRAMVHLCLIFNKQSQPSQALQTAQAALRIAGESADPRLVAILWQRAASAHAALHRADAFVRACDASRNRLEKSTPSHDPTWQWVTAKELLGLNGRGYAALGQHANAQAAYRHMLESPDPRFPRNNLYFQLQLASSLIASGDIAEGAALLANSLPNALALQSGRINSELRQLRSALHPSPVPQARDFVEAYDQATR